ncbi:MAG TPA: hypothetical protein VMT86_17565 [Bryobacteraceae bacterium]|nr:hypothetical protein [Bryobacteraceae bacterium]
MAQKSIRISFSDAPVEQTFYGDIVTLRVEENSGAANTFQIRIATKLESDGSWDYLDDPRFELFTSVEIDVGFTGAAGLAGALGSLAGGLGGGGSDDGLTPLLKGYVTAVRFEASSQPGAATIEVSGMDPTVLMTLEEKIVAWNDMSDSDIAQQILAPCVDQVQADPTATVHQDTDTTILQRSSDARFVRDLAERNGFEFYVEPDASSGDVIAYFRAPQLDGQPQPDLALQFGGQSNLATFSARVTGHRPLAVKVAQMDVAANSPNQAQITDTQLTKIGASDANTLVGGPLGSLVTPADTQAQMLFLGPPTSDATELTTIAQAVRDEAGWFISAQGEVNTDAYMNILRPHRLVLVKGAGKTHSGAYYVTKVVHELQGDGTYKQTFEARRNARDVKGTEPFGGGSLGLPIPGV